MKSNLLRASVIAVVAAAAACAQNTESLKANVPFNFVVRGQVMHAGEVSVGQSAGTSSITIKGVDQKSGVIVLTQSLESRKTAPGQARLVFHRYGDTYFLAEVWGAGEYGSKVPQSNRERELAARGPAQTQTVLLAQR